MNFIRIAFIYIKFVNVAARYLLHIPHFSKRNEKQPHTNNSHFLQRTEQRLHLAHCTLINDEPNSKLHHNNDVIE